MNVRGSVAFVTGSNRGLGKALVNELLRQGAAKIYAAARVPVPSPDTRLIPVELDITNSQQAIAAAAMAGDVNLLINNAGGFQGANVLDGDLDDIRAELETNFFGTLSVTRAFVPVLTKNGGGTLVNILSVLSWLSFGESYSVSKAASWSATNGLRLLLRELGTQIVAVHVGYMDTDMTAGLDVEKASPREVARQIIEGIQQGKSEILADATSAAVKGALSLEPEAMFQAL